MDFSRPAPELVNRWRGFQPWPGAWTTLRGKKLIVHAMRVADDREGGEQASLQIEGERLIVGCRESALELLEVQMEGKRKMAASEFLRGYQIAPGERLGA